ncbi:MAG: glycosyltransferase family 39 protein [Patescibacteria group bacterium]|nr:glycosyltransferase family 39 protein [Patescibacteria group bacterium]
MDWKKFVKTDLFFVSIIILIACANIFIRPYFGSLEMSDTSTYVEGARLLQGEAIETDDHNLTRALKPVPLWGMTAIKKICGFDYQIAFLDFAIIFYLALSALMYYFLKLFFGSGEKHFLFLGAVLFVCAYPMLKSGISMLPESAAIFFYLLGVYLIFCFYKSPNWKWFASSVVIIILGFMVKEYSALAGALLFLVIVFHPLLRIKQKILYIIYYIIFVLALFLPWQMYVYNQLGYTYLDWYSTDLIEQGWSRWYYTVKSLFAVFLLAWFLIPLGIKEWKNLGKNQTSMLKSLIAVSFMIFLWSATDSRLYYVSALPLSILAVMGLKRLSQRTGYALMSVIFIIILAANYLWLGVGDNFYSIINRF